jgi:hypothetical protein
MALGGRDTGLVLRTGASGGHYRSSSAIVTACRRKRKADSRHKDVTSAPTPGRSSGGGLSVVFSLLGTAAVCDECKLGVSDPMMALGGRARHLTQPQILGNIDRFSRDMAPPLHESDETVDQSSPLECSILIARYCCSMR